MLHFHRKTKSIKSLIIILIFAALLPITIVLLAGNAYTRNVLQKQAASINRSTILLHMKTVDNDLDNLTSSMSLFLMDIDFLALFEKNDPDVRIDEQLHIKNTLNKYINTYQNTDGLFFYSPTTADFIEYSKLNESIQDRYAIKDFIQNKINRSDGADIIQNKWIPLVINDKCLLYKVLKQEDIYVGAWIWADTITVPLETLEKNSGTVVFITDSSNQPLTKLQFIEENDIHLNESALKSWQISSNRKYLIIGLTTTMGNFNLYLTVPFKLIIDQSSFIGRLLIFMYLITLVILTFCFTLLKRHIIKPIETLENGMRQIKNGNFDVSLSIPNPTKEINLMVDTFNEMAKEIESLKIKVYEEQLEQSRTHLHYLNLQIKPHFFLNSLNIIYSLALTKDYKLIMEMSVCLTNYFRYMFKSSDSMVSIHEELEHVKNYLHIQELRYSTYFTMQIEVTKDLSDEHIPILFIHTFVENIIKHAYSGTDLIQVNINIELTLHDNSRYLEITVGDKGIGFTQDQLIILNSPVIMKELKENHIGIHNIKQRLHLIYADKAYLHFSNLEQHGAQVLIRIPLNSK